MKPNLSCSECGRICRDNLTLDGQRDAKQAKEAPSHVSTKDLTIEARSMSNDKG